MRLKVLKGKVRYDSFLQPPQYLLFYSHHPSMSCVMSCWISGRRGSAINVAFLG